MKRNGGVLPFNLGPESKVRHGEVGQGEETPYGQENNVEHGQGEPRWPRHDRLHREDSEIVQMAPFPCETEVSGQERVASPKDQQREDR